MRHDFSKILTLYYIAINLEISDFEMSDKFLDPSIASHEVLLYKNLCIEMFKGPKVAFEWGILIKYTIGLIDLWG